ncbi:DUF3298 and DUF4163 domain-containing protein [Solirubrum puertoriconensis]|uniref:DUF3298 domain-containing protein n=1 Tax=Solirubrum puertoriconensis TaxID=1751427 RepID=A0A9X0L3T0_SOLP1|nr:DUF3298 and DUF4163 domain-containing protein [Solirubrum puertoriconensis]KUG06863.1 hypothetical protein ASU33_05935 [Solirubrum puertoriconensis]
MSRHCTLRLGASALLLALAACQERQQTNAEATSDKPTTPPAAAAPTNSPGAWYRQYRGQLPGSPDSITLHLTAAPTGANSELPGYYGSYHRRAGQPFELIGLPTVTPDSLVLQDISPEEGGLENNGPVWRLRRQGNALVGTHAGKAVRLRMVQPMGSVALVARHFTDSVAAYPNEPKTPYAHQSLLALLPVKAPAALQANIVRTLRGDTLSNRPAPTLEGYWQAQLQEYTEEYRANAAELRTDPADTTELPAYALRYDQQQLVRVLWNQAPLLSLGFLNYSYSGGAHGNYGTTVASFDVRNGRALRYADIFRPGVEPQLTQLLNRAVRRTLGIPATARLDQTLLVEQMPVTRNVFLTSGGAVFVYVPYEIASYAQGEIRVFVPYADLRPLLQPSLPLGAQADIANQST